MSISPNKKENSCTAILCCRLESNKEGTRWFGKCWYVHELLKYEFDVEFDIPVTFPMTAPEIALPELDGKTAKMYRGGKICLSDHFKPLWGRDDGGLAQSVILVMVQSFPVKLTPNIMTFVCIINIIIIVLLIHNCNWTFTY